MKTDINLLPRKTMLERLYVPLIIALSIGFLITAAAILGEGWRAEDSAFEQRQEIERTKELIRKQQEEQRTTRLGQALHNLSLQVEDIRQQRTYWGPVMEDVEKHLPSTARLMKLEAVDGDSLNMVSEFTDMNAIAVYMTKIRNSSALRQADITSLLRQERSVTASSSAEQNIEIVQIPYYTVHIHITIGAKEASP